MTMKNYDLQCILSEAQVKEYYPVTQIRLEYFFTIPVMNHFVSGWILTEYRQQTDAR